MKINSRVVIIREAVGKIVQILAEQKVQVTQRGTIAACFYNKKTAKLERINIPYIPDDANDQFIDAIQGFIDHELGHVFFTEPKLLEPAAKEGIGAILNIIEDTYVERKMCEKFRGSAANLSSVGKFYLMEQCDKRVKEGKYIDGLIVPAFRAWAGQPIFQDYMKDKWHLIEKFAKKVGPRMQELLPKINSTQESLEVAREVKRLCLVDLPPEMDMPMSMPSMGGAGDDAPQDDLVMVEKPKPQPSPAEAGDEGDSESTEGGEKSKAPEESKAKPEPTKGEDKDTEPKKDESKPEKSEPKPEKGEESKKATGGDEKGDKPESEKKAESKPEKKEEKSKGEEKGKGEEKKDEKGDEGKKDSKSKKEEPAKPEPEESAGDEGDAGDADDDAPSAAGDEGAGKPEGDEASPGEEDEPGGGGDDDAGAEEEPGGKSEKGDAPASPDKPEPEGKDDKGEPAPDEGKSSKPSIGTGGPIDLEEIERAAEKADYDEALADAISAKAEKMAEKSEYLVYTRDYDKIVPMSSKAGETEVRKLSEAVDHMIGPMQKDLERAIAARSAAVFTGGHRSGRLHSASLHRLKFNRDDVFRRKHVNDTRDVAAEIVIDLSGSMTLSDKLETAARAAYGLSSVLDRMNIVHEVIGFTTRPFPMEVRHELHSKEAHHEYARLEALHMPIIKGFNERMTAEVKGRFAVLSDFHGCRENVDGESIQVAARRLMLRKEKRKVMIVLSDGHPACSGDWPQLLTHLKAVTKQIQASGIDVVGIGIQDDAVKSFYKDYVVLDDIKDLPSECIRQLRELLLSAKMQRAA